MQKQTKNTILFIVLMVLCFLVWLGVKTYFAPPPPPPPVPDGVKQAVADLGAGEAGLWQGLSQEAVLTLEGKESAPEPKPVEKPAPPPVAQQKYTPTPLADLKTILGENSRTSKFHLFAVFDKHGAAVRYLVLNKFQAADIWGRPTTEKDGSPAPEVLIPDDPENPSFLLLAYDVNDKDDTKPFDSLGRVDWSVDGPKTETIDGRVRQSVTFTSPPLKELHGVRITKTFWLTEGDYHLGLEVKAERTGGDDRPLAFRYQLTGGHGLPIEGRWYTYYFRNALVGQVEQDKPDWSGRGVSRYYQDMHQMAGTEGGDVVDKQQGYLIRYAGVAVQYFASVIVVDDKTADGKPQKDQSFLVRARPTLERTVVKGAVTEVGPGYFKLARSDVKKEETFFIRDDDEAKFTGLKVGTRGAVVFTTGSLTAPASAAKPGQPAADDSYPAYAREWLDEGETQPLWEDDVTVRVSTAPVDVKPDHPLDHTYLLYNGPVKVMLLDQPETAAQAVAPGLVNRYIYGLNLNTLTDYQSPSWIGGITGPTGISWMLIQVTNLMHVGLWFLHAYLFVPYILCIFCLTIAVRGVMFPVSRKQALTSLRMQQLAPELKKLNEKHKDDKQALAAAQMEMYRKHGVNPFGTCWMLLLQMPIFMGLYYALQESIHFRLAGLSSWWMPNLAAPDMLLWWTPNIPFISEPSWYGYLWYLGPYLNILPIAAVALTLVQQKWTMPPPTDDQQAQQQKMMKWMMIFMGVMFYKLASGVCIYYIASGLWGVMERKFFLPKKKPGEAAPVEEEKPSGGVLSRLLGPKPGNGDEGTRRPVSAGGRGKRNRRRQEAQARKDEGDGSMFQRLRSWWADILEQAKKK